MKEEVHHLNMKMKFFSIRNVWTSGSDKMTEKIIQFLNLFAPEKQAKRDANPEIWNSINLCHEICSHFDKEIEKLFTLYSIWCGVWSHKCIDGWFFIFIFSHSIELHLPLKELKTEQRMIRFAFLSCSSISSFLREHFIVAHNKWFTIFGAKDIDINVYMNRIGKRKIFSNFATKTDCHKYYLWLWKDRKMRNKRRWEKIRSLNVFDFTESKSDSRANFFRYQNENVIITRDIFLHNWSIRLVWRPKRIATGDHCIFFSWIFICFYSVSTFFLFIFIYLKINVCAPHCFVAVNGKNESVNEHQ